MAEDKYILPVFVFGLRNEDSTLQQFVDKPEFLYSKLKVNNLSTYSVWNAIIKATDISMRNNDELFIIATEDHSYTPFYTENFLMKSIIDGFKRGIDILLGNINDFEFAVPVSKNLFWIDNYKGSSFTIIYNSLYEKILSYNPTEGKTFENIFSEITPHKMVLYPFISNRRTYSFKNYFAERRLKISHEAYLRYNI